MEGKLDLGSGFPVQIYCNRRKGSLSNHFKYKSLKEYCKETGRLQILDEWDTEKNLPYTPEIIAQSSTKIMHWHCEKGHTWTGPVRNRTKRFGCDCPVCANRLLVPGENDLCTLYPDLAKEWHPTKNGDLKPEDFLPTSYTKVWWICEKGHEWEARIDTRTLLGAGARFVSDEKLFKEKTISHPVSLRLPQNGTRPKMVHSNQMKYTVALRCNTGGYARTMAQHGRREF